MRFNLGRVGLGVLLSARCFAGSIDFDSLLDSEIVTNQFAGQGVTFQNSVVLTSAISLNEFELPPRSNFNVISDDDGPMSIMFSTPQSWVFAYFTYLQPVTIEAFDSSNASIGTATSSPACSSNLALSGTPGCSPNEQLSLSGIGVISRVMITGSLAGGSFVLDDLNFNVAGTWPIPEPSTFVLLAMGLPGFAIFHRKRWFQGISW